MRKIYRAIIAHLVKYNFHDQIVLPSQIHVFSHTNHIAGVYLTLQFNVMLIAKKRKMEKKIDRNSIKGSLNAL